MNHTKAPAGDRAGPGSELTARQGLSLRKNFAWLSVGQALYALSQWGVLAILAKLLTSQEVGEFALGLAIATPVGNFAMLGLSHVQATDARGEYRFGHYMALRVLGGVFALLVTALVAAVAADRFETGLVIFTVGVVNVVRMHSDIIYGSFQKDERLDLTARSLILRSLLSPLLLAVGVWYTGRLMPGILCLVLASALILALHDLPLLRRRSRAPSGPQPTWDRRTLTRLFWQALPLAWVAALAALSHQVPRYFIAERLGVAELGYFAVMVYIVGAGHRVVSALGASALARLSRFHARGEPQRFAGLLGKLAGMGMVLGLAGIAVAAVGGPELLTLLYSAEYARYSDEFLLVMAGGALLYTASPLQSGILAARHFRLQFAQHVFVVLVAIASCHFLIGPTGLRGAAYATIVVYGMGLLGVVSLNLWALRAQRLAARAS